MRQTPEQGRVAWPPKVAYSVGKLSNTLVRVRLAIRPIPQGPGRASPESNRAFAQARNPMIDFTTDSVFKLGEINPQEVMGDLQPLLVEGEQVLIAAKTIRDFVAFTNKRIIAMNAQGMTGKKKDFTSLPYSKIQAFSIETAGTFDLDAELDLFFSGLGKVRFEFKGKSNIHYIGQLIANFVL